MENPDQDPNRQDDIESAQLRKLKLEVSSLEWQNSWIGRLTQFGTIFTIVATIFTIVATLFTVWLGFNKLITDREKERELRSKELAERIDNQYRTDINQLLLYPADQNQTAASVIFTLNDLSSVVEKGFQGTDLEKRRSQVGTLLSELIGARSFDLNKVRNVEFDRTALKFCEYYSTYLTENPRDNLVILTAYQFTFGSYYKENKDFAEIRFYPNSDYSWDLPEERFHKIQFKLPQFVEMVYAYRAHVDLLIKGSQDSSQNAENVRPHLRDAFCYFYGSTKNQSATKYVFSINDDELVARNSQCSFR